MRTIESLTLPVGGLVFDVLTAGPAEGEPVLCLHGFPQTAEVWRPVVADLAAAGLRVVAPSQRGYSAGARPTDDADYSMAALVGDVLGMLDELELDQVHLVGHDWGAAVSWHLAGLHAERLRSLTAVSVPHPEAIADAMEGRLGGDQAERSSYMAFFAAPGTAALLTADDAAGLRAVFDASGLPAELAAPHVAALGEEAALDAALAWYRSASGSLIGTLGAIEVPTQLVWGTEDPAFGREGIEATAAHVAGPYRLVEVEGEGHWLPDTVPDLLSRLIVEHVGSI